MHSDKDEAKLPSKWMLIFVLGIPLILILIGINGNFNSNKALKEEYTYTKAQITRFEKHGARNTYPAQYTFIVNEKAYICDLRGNIFCKVLSKKDKEILSRVSFDLVYQPQQPANSRLISSEELYREFNLSYPENNPELTEVLEKYFNCKWSLWRLIN